jgi:alpha-1,3/alpha-1,6-mannosyltransferase
VQSDRIIVNSKFTALKFLEAFASALDKPAVLYPGVEDTCKDDNIIEKDCQDIILFCLQRFDRRKNVDLAIKAFAKFRKGKAEISQNCRLIVAGGYDRRVAENREYLIELQYLCDQYKLTNHTVFGAKIQDLASSDQILFLPSIADQLKRYLYRHSSFLLFTSDEEHFGLVPVEAQMYKLPVIAVSAGGPKETIIDKETGYLVENSAEAVAICIESALRKLNSEEYKLMSCNARKHAVDNFGTNRFGSQLERLIRDIVNE